ncbi:extracellular matrix/biofilm biosynthesis regulator RemA family protein [Neobacillus pocheonensis]|uniref:extracellular matrix regulator RemB n=1 Tax=Neobacillus pocheonensis TaxID=363869 RepID=UPI003D2E690C
MYIHIGEDHNIRAKDIITILDKESANQSELVEEFLTRHKEKVMNLSKNPYKSVIITYDKVYLSPIASGTLKKRSSHLNIQEFL